MSSFIITLNKLLTMKFSDQFEDNSEKLKETFGKEKIDVIIDDAFHFYESIIHSLNELQAYFKEEFVYFIEGNRTAYKKSEIKYPQFNFDYDDDEISNEE